MSTYSFPAAGVTKNVFVVVEKKSDLSIILRGPNTKGEVMKYFIVWYQTAGYTPPGHDIHCFVKTGIRELNAVINDAIKHNMTVIEVEEMDEIDLNQYFEPNEGGCLVIAKIK